MFEQRIEEASLNAWPASQQLFYDGWILRFAGGYTKRANSITPLFPSSIDLDQKIDFCEAIYARHDLPCVFRLPTFAPSAIEQALAQRGYALVDPTLVLYRDIRQACFEGEASIQQEPLDQWIEIFGQLSNTSIDQQHSHTKILKNIFGQCLFATLRIDGQIVACGLGVLEHDIYGLFDIVTVPQWRNQGYGYRLVQAMLSWAIERGAAHAYLQVMMTNLPARHLYCKLGFQEMYQYWYRKPTT